MLLFQKCNTAHFSLPASIYIAEADAAGIVVPAYPVCHYDWASLGGEALGLGVQECGQLLAAGIWCQHTGISEDWGSWDCVRTCALGSAYAT